MTVKTGIFQTRLNESLNTFKDRNALEYGDCLFSYSFIEERSDYAAGLIIGQGIEKETLVGVMIEDRAELIVAMIGVLKAGCVFVPLDGSLPRQRTAYMIGSTGIDVLFCDKNSYNRFFAQDELNRSGMRFIFSDDLFSLKSGSSMKYKEEIHYDANDRIYIYFTSGTSGQPKAIVGKNKSLLHFINWEVETFAISPADRLSQLVTPLFDAFLRDVFAALFAGATLCIPANRDIIIDEVPLRRWVDRCRIAFIHCTPSLFRLLNSGGIRGDCYKNLRCVLLSGEKISPTELSNWYDGFGDRIQLVNLYGPTEMTMIKTYYLIRPDDVHLDRIPIGKPIKGARVVIFDERMEFCDRSVTGEIYIRSPYGTYGYCNEVELTAERFIKNPISNKPGDMLYKTGDLGRFSEGGNIEFIGRIDRQVKLRGIRIELEEIEAVLVKHPGVKEAAVIMVEGSQADQLLRAYILPGKNGDTPGKHDMSVESLKDYLSSVFPDYMVPYDIVFIDNIPKKPNGKIDYEKLPDPADEEKDHFVPPGNPVEKKLQAIWHEVLGPKTIGIDHNFFLLGGNSLNMISLISRIHRDFDKKVSVRDVFVNNTIRKQAEILVDREDVLFDSLNAVEKKEFYDVSSAQRRMYILHRINPDSIGYNMPLAVPLRERVHIEKLEKSIREIVSRHESLRTSFQIIKDELRQLNDESVTFAIERYRMVDKIEETFVRPFDLTKAPLFRAGLIEDETGGYIFLFDMHHIISDDRSREVLESEFFSLYSGNDLPSLKLQYRDFAAWHNSRRQQSLMAQKEKYWLDVFADELPVLDLAADFKRGLVQSFSGACIDFVLDTDITGRLKGFAGENDLTLYMTLLAVFNILLAKLSGLEDIIIGTPIEGRHHVDFENIIGMFVNTLALRNFPRGEQTIGDFFADVKRTVLTALENQEYQFEDLVEKISPPRNTGRNPIFDVMFNLFSDEPGRSEIPLPDEGIEFNIERRTVKFDLVLTAVDDGEKLHFKFDYCTKLYKESTIRAWVGFFKKLLLLSISEAGKKISDIDMVTGEEKKRLLFDFNNTGVEYDGSPFVYRIFEDQVEKTPHHIALVHENEQLTYHELNERTDRLMRALKRQGAKREHITAIIVERSFEMVIGIFAIMKSGGGFLPIVSHYPRERIDFMLEDSNTKLVLTAEPDRHRFGDRCRVIDIGDEKKHDCNICDLEERDSGQLPTDLAYMIYTSGSTGKPKAVLIEHISLINILNCMQREYPLEEADAYLLKTTFVFDVAMTELFGWFFAGGRLAVLEKDGEKDPEKILETIFNFNITHINFVPSMFNAFLDELDTGSIDKCSSLKYIFVAGEALLPEFVNRFKPFSKEIELVNIYGPTEGTIYTTRYSLNKWHPQERIKIGEPMHNIKIAVQDKYGNIQPIGVPGELCITGSGVARGYLNRVDLAGDVFRGHPFDTAANERFYFTGDLACWDGDGNIEFLGRIDHQVKIRGNRIELGEVENCLLRFPAVREAKALVCGGEAPEDRRLAVFLAVDRAQVDIKDEAGKKEFSNDIGNDLKQRLPDYMIPSSFIVLDALPLNKSGKIDNIKLLEWESKKSAQKGSVMPVTEVEQKIADIWRRVVKVDHIGLDDNFFDMGGNSLNIVRVNKRLKQTFEKTISVAEMFRYTTVRTLAQYFKAADSPGPEESTALLTAPEQAVLKDTAVIGMAGRFPGANNIEEYWENLKNGIESVSFFSDRELEQAGVSSALLKDPHFVKAGGGLEEIENFDAAFFGYSAKEAELMEPQMRILHECAWSALEDAGYVPGRYAGTIGIFAGSSANFKWEALTLLSGKRREMGEYASRQLSARDFLCTRVSYKLDLKGPAVVVQSNCSTSLVAINLACRAILNGDCDMALAGGVTISSHDRAGYTYYEGMIYSPDGHCRAFDSRAGGTIFSDGVGIVVLKSFEKALNDGDHIYAVVKGSAVNNDGVGKVGYSAPGVEGQESVIKSALDNAGIDPGTITYVETHGTGTVLGDPVEIEALNRAFAVSKRNKCALGSVKTNIGHTDSAAGAAGFLKTVLALKHKLIPPALHFSALNPEIDFENSPFYVNKELKEWTGDNGPLRAGVSSFGIGGTNAHVVLEEWLASGGPPFCKKVGPKTFDEGHDSEIPSHGGVPRSGGVGLSSSPQLILLSAKSPAVLETMTKNLVSHLENNPGVNVADAAYTLQAGREFFPHRRMGVCREVEEVVDLLSSLHPEKVRTAAVEKENRPVVFMFPGQGSQYVNMARGIYEMEPLFREEMDRCFEFLKSLADFDLKAVLYPRESGNSPGSELKPVGEPAENSINQTEMAQPLIFIIEYALAKLLSKLGIEPYAMVGHSIGEYAAACLAGVFSLSDALELVALRGKLMAKMPAGSMLSVPLPEKELKPLLSAGLSLAAVNGPAHCVVSGSYEAIDEFLGILKEKGCEFRRLHTSHAFHSGMMDPILKEFEEKVRQVKPEEPRVPYISNLTGNWISGQEATDPNYWVKHLRHPVRFSDGISELLKKEKTIFVEVGPGKTLSTFLRQYKDQVEGHSIVDMIRHPADQVSDRYNLLDKIGRLWLYGLPVAWDKFDNHKKRQRISLPTYPFERKRYWIEGDPFKNGLELLVKEKLLQKQEDMADWFYVPLWQQSVPHAYNGRMPAGQDNWLIFTRPSGIGAGIVNRLQEMGQAVFTVEPGAAFTKRSGSEFIVNPAQEEDYDTLFKELLNCDAAPAKVMHLWGISGEESVIPDLENLEICLERGFYSILNIVRSAARQGLSQEIEVTVGTDNMQDVNGEETISPLKAAILGAVKIIPMEYPNISCRSIDIGHPGNGDAGAGKLIDYVIGECMIPSDDPVIAYRGSYRWVPVFKPVRLEMNRGIEKRLKEKGVYLITGGFGGMGFTLTEFLAKRVKARLILIGRSDFPSRQAWQSWLSKHGPDDPVSLKIIKIREMEEAGAKVMTFSSDAADAEEMRQVVTAAEKKFGKINGILHTAGAADYEGVIQRRSREQFERILRPKVNGTLVLDHIFKDRKLDFFVLFSSIGNIVYRTKFGQAGYNAANEFLDAYACSRKNREGETTVSINWDDWAEVGMTAAAAAERRGSSREKRDDENLVNHALSPVEGAEVFERILGTSLPRVIVSTSELNALLEQSKEYDRLSGRTGTDDEDESQATIDRRPELSTAYTPPGDEIEQGVTGIFQRFFGIETVGIYDDFFELGGDSLKAVTIIANIYELFNVRIGLPVFFSRPTAAGLAHCIKQSKRDEYVSISPVEEKEYYNLSSAQRRLYILQQMDPGTTSYNMPYVIDLEGEINIKTLKNCLEKLVRRHESLQTSFMMLENREPVQRINRDAECDIEKRALADDPVEERNIAGTVDSFIRPFDLSRAPLLRIGLIRRGDTGYIVVFDMHHIIADGTAQLILEREFHEMYSGKEPEPAAFHIRYKDYSEWQNSSAEKARLKKQEDYWLEQLKGEQPQLDLPYDFKKTSVQSSDCSMFNFTIEKRQMESLKKASGEDVTTFMVLLTLINVFLSKISGGRERIQLGTLVANRGFTGLQPVIGMFANTLVLRNLPVKEITFREFLLDIKRNTLQAFENREYLYEDLVKNAAGKKDVSRNPLFDVLFGFRNIEPYRDELTGDDIQFSKLAPYLGERRMAKFELIFFAVESRGDIFLSIEYDTALFKKETIEKLAGYFKEILGVVEENMEIKLKDIELARDLFSRRITIPALEVRL